MDFNNIGLKEKLFITASYVRMKIEEENKDINRSLGGTCIDASTEIQAMLKEIGIKSEFVEGLITLDVQAEILPHCWIEVTTDTEKYYVDVTASQFNNSMLTKYPPILITKKLPQGFSYTNSCF
jgi:arylamine N-acetyltransferase